jgi:hypothetical protein
MSEGDRSRSVEEEEEGDEEGNEDGTSPQSNTNETQMGGTLQTDNALSSINYLSSDTQRYVQWFGVWLLPGLCAETSESWSVQSYHLTCNVQIVRNWPLVLLFWILVGTACAKSASIHVVRFSLRQASCH